MRLLSLTRHSTQLDKSTCPGLVGLNCSWLPSTMMEAHKVCRHWDRRVRLLHPQSDPPVWRTGRYAGGHYPQDHMHIFAHTPTNKKCMGEAHCSIFLKLARRLLHFCCLHQCLCKSTVTMGTPVLTTADQLYKMGVTCSWATSPPTQGEDSPPQEPR